MEGKGDGSGGVLTAAAVLIIMLALIAVHLIEARMGPIRP